MSKKDFERAAEIVQEVRRDCRRAGTAFGGVVEDAFAEFFRGSNPRFDEGRFRRACVPGANVRARG